MSRSGYSAKIALLLFFLLVLTPTVGAQSTIGEGSVSRIPIWNNSIEQDYFFDGANYRMITKYGDYVFLQPNNIMEYWNLDGEEIIDKSVWILQHNTTGTWLPLLDFDNQRITLVNETFYEIAYDVEYKDKGPSQVVGSVEIGFYSSGYSRNKPKIIVNFTKGPAWDTINGGMGSFRWIWDVVPKGDWFKLVNQSSRSYVDVSVEDVNLKSDKIYFTDNDTYSDLDEWISLDVSDYGAVDIFGGDESFFNTRGFILIFDENEGYIDPSTIGTGYGPEATDYEAQRKVFRNPRGSEYYYAIFEGGASNWYMYNSSDGVTWNRVYDFAGQLDLDYVLTTEPLDLIIWEDDTNNVLHVVYALVGGGANNQIELMETLIFDNGTITGNYSVFVAGKTDDGVWNPNIEIDDDGYIWVSWTDEYTKSGKQRNDVYAIHSQSTYPISAPSWSNVVKVYDGNSLTRDPFFDGLSELVKTTATSDVGLVYWIQEYVAGKRLYGRTSTRASPLSGTPTTGNQVLIDSSPAVLEFSSVAETEVNSDIFIATYDGFYFYIFEWDISGDSSSTFDSIQPETEVSCVLSLNASANPDNLMLVTIEGDGLPSNNISIYETNVTVGDFILVDRYLESEHTFDDLSAYWICNDSLIFIYRNTSQPYYIRFYEYPPPPAIIYPGDPDSLFGAGFNGTVTGYVLLYWNHSLVDVTDFEVHNSSDGVSFTFLDNVTVAYYNHSSIGNMTYHYYRVRARYYQDYYGQYFNSSWTDTNFERVFFSSVGGGVAEGGEPYTILGLMIGLIMGLGILFSGVVKR